MASTIDEKAFLVAMSRLVSNHTGTRAHLQSRQANCIKAPGRICRQAIYIKKINLANIFSAMQKKFSHAKKKFFSVLQNAFLVRHFAYLV
jgi:hypothetical protein